MAYIKNYFMCRMYNELAEDWYRLITPVTEYKEEAEFFHQLFEKKAKGKTQTLLELGCGAGHNAFYLKQWYTLTLTDISEPMLNLSRQLNPECEHIISDMRTLMLNRLFDGVFIHDSIVYMTSLDELTQVICTAAIHCRSGGMLLIAPDYVKETFKDGVDDGGSDDGTRALRYLEWKQDHDPEDDVYDVDYAFLLRHEDGRVTAEHDRHVEGLFSTATWLNLLEENGFTAESVTDAEGVKLIGHRR
jgi:SAM-dependent methyltransferase